MVADISSYASSRIRSSASFLSSSRLLLSSTSSSIVPSPSTPVSSSRWTCDENAATLPPPKLNNPERFPGGAYGSLGFSSSSRCLGLGETGAPRGTTSYTLAAVREGSAKGLTSSSSSLTSTVRCEPSPLVEDDIASGARLEVTSGPRKNPRHFSFLGKSYYKQQSKILLGLWRSLDRAEALRHGRTLLHRPGERVEGFLVSLQHAR